MAQHIQKIWSLYIITNAVNDKKYIGQTTNIAKRFSDHRRAFYKNKPSQAIHFAFLKYGIDNFKFEIIASCKSQDDANYLETELVKQYNTYIQFNTGYNVTYGGMNAPKSDKFKKMMRDWHASLSIEEKEKIKQQQREATIKQIATQGHPALGTKRTAEQKANMSMIQKSKDNESIYTQEVRKHMSEVHIGHKDSENTKKNKSISAIDAWKRRIDYTDIKCSVPGCNICGKAKYKIIDGIRYCNKHGLRMLRYGRLDTIKQ